MTSFVALLAVLLTALGGSGVDGYKTGPPVEFHTDICDSMSPVEGHSVSARRTLPPFEVRVISTEGCYSHGRQIKVSLLSKPDERNYSIHFEGLFVQARPAGSVLPSYNYNNGQFSTNGDPQLQALSCPGSNNNSLGHREANRYYNKTFLWTPHDSVRTNIQFVATVVHEIDDYWIGVTSPVLHYDVDCVYSAASSLPLGVVTSTTTALLVMAVALLASRLI